MPDVRRRADRRLLLLDVGRPHREHRERVADVADRVPQGRRRPLRHLRDATTSGPRTRSVQASTWYSNKLGGYNADTNPTGVKGSLRTIYVREARRLTARRQGGRLSAATGSTWVSGASLRYKLVAARHLGRASAASRSTRPTRASPTAARRLSRGRPTPARRRRRGRPCTSTATAPGRRDRSRPAPHPGPGLRLQRRYSTFSVSPSRQEATTYYVTRGDARSPKVKVTGGRGREATASDTDVAAGRPRDGSPAAYAPSRRRDGLCCRRNGAAPGPNAASGALTAEARFSLDWTAVAGVTALRVKVPATNGFVAGFSPNIALTVTD